MLQEMIEHPKMDFESILTSIKFNKHSMEEILSKVPILYEKFTEGKDNISKPDLKDWIMGQLRNIALGNVNLTELSKEI